MDLGLKGKVAIITGGSEGIGYAAAWEMANEGANVVICARTLVPLEDAAKKIKTETGNSVTAISCDVTIPSAIESLFSDVIERFGAVHILVNNAGTSSAAPFDETPDETWDYDIDLKLYGAIRCSRLAIDQMKKQSYGRIINITTPGGKAPTASSVPTSVSRAAGIALTKAMSKDFAKHNILVNTVGVGLIRSGQHRKRWEIKTDSNPNLSLDDFYQEMGSGIPMGRVGDANEVGAVIAFLASEKASYITGASINVDGGTSPVV
ncbi:MAG: short-chain dehydrogenase [Chloroflexi bacterium]|nr:short-chain dehydrogenase [Chloroflexota bacterium]